MPISPEYNSFVRNGKVNNFVCWSLGPLSASTLRTKLDATDETLWEKYNFRQRHIHVHANVPALRIYWLKSSWKRLTKEPMTVYRFTEFNEFFPIIDSLISHISQMFPNCSVTRVMFAKLLPNTSIPAHTDTAEAIALAHRIHWVIATDPSVIFSIDRQEFHLEADRLYETNNVRLHSVKNPSQTPRIHCILDLMPNANIQNGIQYVDLNFDQSRDFDPHS